MLFPLPKSGVNLINFDKGVLAENIHTTPPPPHTHSTEGNRISEGVGVVYKGFFFFRGFNSFSVGRAVSYFTVTSVSKQVLLFALLFFYTVG